MVDVLGCLADNIRVHLYGLPWLAGGPPAGSHSEAEGAIVRLAAKWKVGSSREGSTRHCEHLLSVLQAASLVHTLVA